MLSGSQEPVLGIRVLARKTMGAASASNNRPSLMSATYDLLSLRRAAKEKSSRSRVIFNLNIKFV